MLNFKELNLDPMILKSLDEQGIVTPSEIQAQAIPVAMQGKDVVAKAPTGTGKTLGFLLPIISMIEKSNSKVQALVLCPTRELAVHRTTTPKSICDY